mgnify:CR=1 FL=1
MAKILDGKMLSQKIKDELKYYNMDLVVNSAIEMAEKIIKGE